MANLLKRIYSVDNMLGSQPLLGEPLHTREAYRTLTAIALPSVMEMVLMSLIGSIDTMMVGSIEGVGSVAIAAVGLTGQPRMLMLCLFFAMNTGVTAIVARRKGEGRQGDANRTMRNAVWMVLAMSAVVMAVGLAFSKPLMRLAGAGDDTVDMANTYFRILTWFLPLNGLTMCLNAAQRGTGNTRTTMYVNITANLVNVLFNYLLIGGNCGFPKLGVAGAAYATAIGFCVGFALCLYTLFRGRGSTVYLRLSRHDDWRPDKETIMGIAKIGGNAMWEQLALRIGFFAYARIVAGLGTAAFAAHQVNMQLLNMSFTFGDGIGIAGTSLVGQMLGKNRPDLSTIYGKCSQRLAMTVALVIATIFITFRYQIIGLFLDAGAEPQTFELAVGLVLILAIYQPVQTSSIVLSGCLRGAGDVKFVAMVMVICVALIRPICSLLAVYAFNWGLYGAWLASLLDMTMRLILVRRRFSGGKWHDIRV